MPRRVEVHIESFGSAFTSFDQSTNQSFPISICSRQSAMTETETTEPETETEAETSDPSDGLGGTETDSGEDSDIAAPTGNLTANESTADTFNNEASQTNFDIEAINLTIDNSATYSSTDNVRVADLNFQLAQHAHDRFVAMSKFESDFVTNVFWDELDKSTRDHFNELQIGVPSLVASTASFLTVGYVAWIIRGGVLLTTFMSSIPAWKTLDITPILESSTLADEDDESIEQMVDSKD